MNLYEENFLMNGGFLVRLTALSNGRYVIQEKTLLTDWHELVAFEDKNTAVLILEKMIEAYPDKFLIVNN